MAAPPPDIAPLSLHDALPISSGVQGVNPTVTLTATGGAVVAAGKVDTCATTGTNAAGQCTVTLTSNSAGTVTGQDRKSTRLNSSHLVNSYADFCLRKTQQHGT